MDKDDILRVASGAMVFWLVLAAVFLVVHASAPLLGGRLSIFAVAKYASWIALALAARRLLGYEKAKKNIPAAEWVLVCVLTIATLVLSIPYPASILLSILAIVADWTIYRKRRTYPDHEGANEQ